MVNAFLSVEFLTGGPWGVSQTRYLHREWNRRSPRVRKYHSVPVLRLVPSDRPLFFCDNCCSANFYVPICLWCKWTSAAARKSFEEKAPRGRTMSTPKSCSVGLGRTTKGGLKGGVLPEKIVPRGSLDTDRSTEPPETPRSLFRADNSPAIAAMEEWVNISEDEIPLSSSDPYHQGQVRNKRQHPSAIDDNRNSIISFNRSLHAPWSDDGIYGFQSFSDDEPQGYRRSTDSRYSGTKSEGYVPRPTGNLARTRRTVVQSPSPPPSFNRRPLYHYIRSGASASQSTFDCGVVPEITPKRHIVTHQGANHLVWQSEASPTSVVKPSLPTSIPPIASLSRNGFSLSGETEQRMDLARIAHDDRFVFHESKPTRKRDRVMRGLRRSFKNFFKSKVDS